MNAAALSVFIVLFLLVTVLGFYASRWQQGNLRTIDEWGLGGRRFGTLISWFLIGGDLYTAYTFIAVPALIYASGAIGFFAVPYTLIVYPLVFLIMPRFWAVAKAKGYVTASDFVRGRFDSHWLALAVAITGILATMPYIALQLVGMQAVLTTLGFSNELPLIIAFVVLAVYTYTGGLRAPALVAIVKDVLIYVTIIAALIIIPAKLGGFAHIFASAQAQLGANKTPGSIFLSPKAYTAYATLALGSALALFLYPHAITGVLSTKNTTVIKRNAVLLPLYSLVLGFIALLGYMALAAHVNIGKTTALAVPALFEKMFPQWFVGFAFAAVMIGALVPAAIMSIAAANLFSRNIYKEYFKKDASDEDQGRVAKIVSLLVKFGALAFVLAIATPNIIQFQLLGGIWMLQILPSVMLGLYTRWFDRTALLIAWLAGMVVGTSMAASLAFKSSAYPLVLGGSTVVGYAGVWALIVNLVLAVVLTLILKAVKVPAGHDHTVPSDYYDQPETSGR
ncbi:MAG: monocarboxylate uptake permease MctP [Sulfobacillus sp.]